MNCCASAFSHNTRRSYSLGCEKSERTHFNTLPRRSVRRSRRIIERGMRGESSTLFFRVVDLENDRFVAAHLGEIDPPMIGIGFEPIGLADPVRITALGDHEIAKRNTPGIGKR